MTSAVRAAARLVLLLGAPLVLVLGWALPGHALAASSPLSWSAPNHVDNLQEIQHGASIACPTGSDACAVAYGNSVYTTSDVEAGVSTRWSGKVVDQAFQGTLSAIACPSTSLCLAVDATSSSPAVSTSTDPMSPSSTWGSEQIETTLGGGTDQPLTGVACFSPSPGASDCIVVNMAGYAYSTADPQDGSTATWTSESIDGGHHLTAIDCDPAGDLCAAVDDAGDLVVTQDPQDGAAASWTSPTSIDSHGLNAIACPSAGLCVATDSAGNVAGGDPTTAGTTPWTPQDVDGTTSITGVACPTASLCLAVDAAGNSVSSTDPVDGINASWQTETANPNVSESAHPPLSGIACETSSWCVAVDRMGTQAFTGDAQDADTAFWESEPFSANGYLNAISCATGTPSVCVAGDDAGNVAITADPVPGASSVWTVRELGNEHELGQIRAVSCPTTSFCAATHWTVTGTTVDVSTDPADGSGSTWEAEPAGDGTNQLVSLSCPSSSLCVAGDLQGDLVTSTNPGAGASATWTVDPVDGSNHINGIACPTTGLCVAVDDHGNALISTDPGAASPAWTIKAIDTNPEPQLLTVACAGESLCLAGDLSGHVLTSSDPKQGAASSWSAAPVDTGQITGLSCPSGGLCVAVDSDGSALTTTDPGDGAAATWASSNIDGSSSLSGVSCPSAVLCAAVDTGGQAMEATGSGATSTSTSTSTTSTTSTTTSTTTTTASTTTATTSTTTATTTTTTTSSSAPTRTTTPTTPTITPPAGTGAITGTVTTGKGGAAAGVEIIACTAVTRRVCAVTDSGADGGYRLVGLPPATYDVEIDPAGAALGGASAVVTVAAGQISRQDFGLQAPQPLSGGVTISSGATTSSSGVPVIDWGSPYSIEEPLDIPATAAPNTKTIYVRTLAVGADDGTGISPDGAQFSVALLVARYGSTGRIDGLTPPLTATGVPVAGGGATVAAASGRGADAVARAAFDCTQRQIGLHPTPSGGVQLTIPLGDGPGAPTVTLRLEQANLLGFIPAVGSNVPHSDALNTIGGALGQTATDFVPPAAVYNTVVSMLNSAAAFNDGFQQLRQNGGTGDLTGAVAGLGLKVLSEGLDHKTHGLASAFLHKFAGQTLTNLVQQLPCPPTPPNNFYVDPSGTIETRAGVPLPAAKATILRAKRRRGPFAKIRNGSTELSPANRRNPDRTDALGRFGWDVVPGIYRVAGAHRGCTKAASSALTVPPAVTGVTLRLRCRAIRRRATRTTLQRLAPRGARTVLLVAHVTGRGGTPLGTVTFRQGRHRFAATLRRGMAELSVAPKAASRFVAAYGGDGAFAPSRSHGLSPYRRR